MRSMVAALTGAALLLGVTAGGAGGHDEGSCECYWWQPQLAPDTGLLRQEGELRVVDGDTLAIGGRRLRLWGIDAPERRTACPDGRGGEADCGAIAADHLGRLLSGHLNGGLRAVCDVVGHDTRWDRPVVTCSQSGKYTHMLDFSLEMVAFGYARADAAYANEELRLVERGAREHGSGFWACDAPTPKGWEADKDCPG